MVNYERLTKRELIAHIQELEAELNTIMCEQTDHEGMWRTAVDERDALAAVIEQAKEALGPEYALDRTDRMKEAARILGAVEMNAALREYEQRTKVGVLEALIDRIDVFYGPGVSVPARAVVRDHITDIKEGRS